jgi:hypothetical protein
MFSSTLERSAATLGVVAGLLAAAGPASAQLPPTASGVKAPTNPEQQRVVELPEEGDAQLQRRVPDRAIGTVEELLELNAPANAGAAVAGLNFAGLIVYNGHAGLGARGIDVSMDHTEIYGVVTDNNDPDTGAIARGSRDIAGAAYQHDQTDLEHG